ncbi:MAG: helix-turn-helix transcriptional regulator, partial [Betaproteobacteria bacterium]|nr:helix-turn-helix transcriptional regulator [Betaproteobacteria bacterium]
MSGESVGLDEVGEAGRRALGDFLRAVRGRLTPAEFALAAGARRRTPGLRREEVAALCGISPTWYTWIEQGRTVDVSPKTLGDMAAGLRLTPAERAYLFQLAGKADPLAGGPSGQADGEGLDILVRSVGTPAYVLGRNWGALSWNLPAARLFEDWLGRRASAGTGQAGPNLLRYVFAHPGAPDLIVDWESRAYRLVAEYRADSAAFRDDPGHQQLLAELRAQSGVFDAAWRSQTVLAREGGLRSFRDASGAISRYRQFTLRIANA